MKICGIVAEYNPFHSGHQYQIAATRALLGENAAVVCVMSGNFVQRGEPAVFWKHARAEAALGRNCGADLVLELPLPWALSSAEGFARGAAALLAATGIVSHLSFGSESGDPDALDRIAALLLRPELDGLLREELRRGVSYAAARQAAAERLAGRTLDPLRAPNDILGIEYLKALRTLGAGLIPVAVRRRGAAHDAAGEGEYASAAQLRQTLAAGGGLPASVPPAAREIFERETAAGRGPVLPASLDAALLSRLRALPVEAFAALPDASEGLENRLYRAAREEPTLSATVAAAAAKRYPAARLRRMLWCAALGVRREDVSDGKTPPYIRVLGANGTGRALLARMRESASLPVITKPAAAHKLDARGRRVFALEAGAADLYALGFPDPAQRRGGGEWRRGPVILP